MQAQYLNPVEGLTYESEPFFDLQGLENGLVDRPLPEIDSSEVALLEEVRNFYQEMKGRQPEVAEIYQPAGEWREHVIRRMPHYSAFAENSVDSLASLLGNFWRNELGVLVKQYAGYGQLVADPDRRRAYATLMAHDLMVWTHLYGADPGELAISEVGNPWGYQWKGTTIGSKVLRYHVLNSQIEQMTIDLRSLVVAEIGAGYGGMAYFLMKGSQARTYIDFDLPETLAVAAYHLRKALPHRKVYLHGGGTPDWTALLAEFDVILMPNWCIDSVPEDSVDVFLNTFSLSEMSRPVVKNYLAKVGGACRGYFLHNNMDRAGVVNEGHERIPASSYPFPEGAFKLLSKHYDLFQQKHSGRDGDYREFLYQKVGKIGAA